jgi:DNA-binding protein YbaB
MSRPNDPSEKALLDQIKNSISGMQDDMKTTYDKLSGEQVVGQSSEKPEPYVKVIVKANYEFVDLLFDKNALQGGVSEFKHRIKTAWSDALGQVQKITQERTMELLKGMNIPPNLQGLSDPNKSEDDQ